MLIKKLFTPLFYQSEIDQTLASFDQSHPELSLSQRAEKIKYARIHALRDTGKKKNTSKNSRDALCNDFLDN